MKLEKCLKKRTEFDTRIEDSLSLILYGYDVSNSIHFAVKPRASEHEMCREASKAMISSVIQPLSIRYATTMALARYYESKTAPTPRCINPRDAEPEMENRSISPMALTPSYSKTAAMIPAAIPPTVPSILLPALPCFDAVGLVAVALPVEVGEEDELGAAVDAATALTSVGMRVPHVLQDWEPGFV